MADKEIREALNEIKTMLKQILDQAEVNASLTEAVLDEIVPANLEQ